MTKNYDHRQNRGARSSYRGPRKGRRTPKKAFLPLAAAGTGLLLLAAVSAVTVSHFKEKGVFQTQESPAADTEPALTAASVTVNGISLEGLNQDEVYEKIKELFPWSMKAAYGDEQLPVTDLLQPRLKKWAQQLCTSSQSGEITLTAADLVDDQLEKDALAQARTLAGQWEIAPKNSGLDYFDKEKGSFVFSDGCSGIEIDEEQMAQDILSAIRENRLDAVITARSSDAAPALSAAQAKEAYKTIATFTTETTNNQKRNTNVRLAAEALNGTIVQPGDEFSFNSVVGQRTAEKGYQEASAYNSGSVVQEIGGGVCQISSTLYRVVFNAGMKVTFRRSHTFEPNYVTPGQDAAISWEQPDFRFVNTSDAPIGIRASYADRKATVSIYGIPVLEDGVSWDLYSEKVEELDPPEPEYVEDPTLAPGTEKVVKAATPGSRWDTYKVVSKNGKEIERTLDHSKSYKGHAAVIHRNTSSGETAPSQAGTDAAAPTETSAAHTAEGQTSGATENAGSTSSLENGSQPAGSESTAPSPTVDGMPEGYTPGTGVIAPFQPENQ